MSLESLTLLVVHYRTPELLATCLHKLNAFAGGARVIVLDSSPEGETPSVAAEVVRVPNHSFAHTVNCGLKLAQTPLIAHMNADVFVSAETFPALLEAVQKPHVGMVGPRARTQAGRFQDQGLPYRAHYLRSSLGKAKSVPVPWLSGCLHLVRTDALQTVGGMDGSLRFYNEDMEWCFRFRRAGWACHLVKTDVLHLGGSSTPNDPRFMLEGYRGGYKLSQRYHGALYQALHRSVVGVQSGWEMKFSRNSAQRRAAAQIREMFRHGTFDESPFGKTLDETNPVFAEALKD